MTVCTPVCPSDEYWDILHLVNSTFILLQHPVTSISNWVFTNCQGCRWTPLMIFMFHLSECLGLTPSFCVPCPAIQAAHTDQSCWPSSPAPLSRQLTLTSPAVQYADQYCCQVLAAQEPPTASRLPSSGLGSETTNVLTRQLPSKSTTRSTPTTPRRGRPRPPAPPPPLPSLFSRGRRGGPPHQELPPVNHWPGLFGLSSTPSPSSSS